MPAEAGIQGREVQPLHVMPGLDPGIHVFGGSQQAGRGWPGQGPAMTNSETVVSLFVGLAPPFGKGDERIARLRRTPLLYSVVGPFLDRCVGRGRRRWSVALHYPIITTCCVIVRPPAGSGRVTLKLCNPGGTAGKRLLSRRDGAAYKRAARIGWGARLRPR